MYTEKFKQVVQCCKENNLFVGYGNPNGKVLVIGKEAAHVEGDIQQLKKAKERFCDINIKSWEEVLSENEVPNYDSENPVIERFEDIKKPQYQENTTKVPVIPIQTMKSSTNNYFYREKNSKKSTFKRSFSSPSSATTLLKKATKMRI